MAARQLSFAVDAAGDLLRERLGAGADSELPGPAGRPVFSPGDVDGADQVESFRMGSGQNSSCQEFNDYGTPLSGSLPASGETGVWP